MKKKREEKGKKHGISKMIVNGILCHFLYHVKYTGLENLNKYDKCLICPNHSKIFDPVFIFPKTNNIYFMAKSELFKNKILGKIFKYYGAFPVVRGKIDTKSTKHAIDLIKKNEKIKLLIFTEGGILENNKEVRRVKNGAVFFAATCDVPIIPVYITTKPKLFHKVEVIIGKGIYFSKECLENKETLHKASRDLLDTIYRLDENR